MRNYKLWFWLIAPYVLYYLGFAMNVLVISVNHGTMPVAIPAHMQGAIDVATASGIINGGLIDQVHKVMVNGDHLKWLADWIQLDQIGTASPGDCFLWVGDVLKIPFFVVFLVKIWERTWRSQ